MSFDTIIAKTRQAIANDPRKRTWYSPRKGRWSGSPGGYQDGRVQLQGGRAPLDGRPQRRLLGSASRSRPRRQASRASPRIAIMMMPENTRAVFR